MKKTGTIALICALALSLMNAPAAGAWAVLPDGGTPGHGVHMAQGEQTAAVEEDTGLLYEDEEALSRLLGELPSTITEAQAEEAGHILRLKEEEPDLNTVIFQNRDGTRTAYQYAYPVKYIENGTIKDKSNRIISSDKAGYAYENEANEIKTYYPERLGNKGARLEYGGYAVELMPQIRGGGAAYSLFGGGSLQAAQVIEEITPAADGVHYSGALGAGAALRYTPTLTGFKEDIILSSYQGENEFSFVLKTNGLLLEETGGNWYLIDEDTEEAVIELGEIYIYDSFSGITAGAEGGENVHETYGELGAEEIERGEEYIITVTAPEEYLEAGSTVYPVYIDPTFNVVSTYIQDTHISSGYPGNNYNTSALLNLGYGSSSKSTRILSRITSLSNGIQQPGWELGVQVDSVIYHMYCTSSYTSNPYVDVYRAGASWSTTGATWSNASSSTYSGAVLLSSTQVGNKGWYEFDITGAYNYWLTPGMTNNGLLFKMRVESSTENYWRQFASATYSDSSKLPYLTVVYNEPVSIEINPYSMRLYMGESYRPAISATPSGAALGVAYWSSSNTSVARVNSTTGEITAVGAGTATITVTIYTGVTTATGSCSVSVFSGTPPAVMGEVYHIFNANSTKPISPREGNVTDNGQVAQESYRPASAGYQKWEVIRLFNGYYVIRSAQNSNMALSGAGTLLKLSNIGGSNNYSDVPMEAQWTLSGSAGSELNLTARSSGKGICIEGDTVWAGENIIMGSVGSKSKGFLFIRPGDYVPTTGVSLQNPIYLLKNGDYICMPQITPSNATFRRVIWSWEGRSSGSETDITMQNYAWGTSTASYTGTIVTGINEGVTWLRAYCSDTNYNSTVNVDVHFLESGPYLFKNRESNKYMSVEGQSTAAGAQIIQESYKGELWQEFYLQRDFTTGYIRIKNRNSSQYLGVENNSSAHDADIKQYAYSASGIGQQFKIERISGGDTIKIIPRTGEGQTPQRVVCVANYIANTDGVHIKQRDFGANDGYYRDEWYVYSKIEPSGDEIDYNPSIWNINSVKLNTNCYSYAMNNQQYVMQPGMHSGRSEWNYANITNINFLKEYIEWDSEAMNFTFEEIGRDDTCTQGTYKIALVLDPGNDYHFYRQNPDGTWSHKPGTTEVVNTDASGNVIHDPQYANRNYGTINYSIFIGYYKVTPLNYIYSAQNIISQNSVINTTILLEMHKQNYPEIDSIDNISIGSTIEEVTEYLGLPQRSVTFGLQSADYYMSNGKIVRIYYSFDSQAGLTVAQIKVL